MMYKLTIETKYVFGDVVSFDSQYNGKGLGFISGITILPGEKLLYEIVLANDSVQPGIEASEITQVSDIPQEFRLRLRGAGCGVGPY